MLAYKNGQCFAPKKWMRYDMTFVFIVKGVSKINLTDEEWSTIL